MYKRQTINLAAALQLKKKRVLMIDMDGQANLTESCGLSIEEEQTVYGSIFADEALVGAITAANIDVSSLFAAEAFIAQLNAVDISGNESLRLVVDTAKDEALDATGEAVAQIALTAEPVSYTHLDVYKRQPRWWIWATTLLLPKSPSWKWRTAWPARASRLV